MTSAAEWGALLEMIDSVLYFSSGRTGVAVGLDKVGVADATTVVGLMVGNGVRVRVRVGVAVADAVGVLVIVAVRVGVGVEDGTANANLVGVRSTWVGVGDGASDEHAVIQNITTKTQKHQGLILLCLGVLAVTQIFSGKFIRSKRPRHFGQAARMIGIVPFRARQVQSQQLTWDHRDERR